MNKRIITTLLTAWLLASCASAPITDNAEANESYTLLYGSFRAIRDSRHKFLSAMADALYEIKANNQVSVDTVQLSNLYVQVERENRTRKDIMRQTKELKNDYEFKNKCLKYSELLQNLYQNTFPEYIRVIGSDRPDRYDACCKLLLQSRLDKLERAEYACEDAGEKIKEQYHLPLLLRDK